MAKPARKHWTFEDWKQLPHDDGNRYEILRGELVVTFTAVIAHQYTVGRLHLLLEEWSSRGRGGLVVLGPLATILSDDTVCLPDILWISDERAEKRLDDWIYGTPDLVIEVQSPSTARRDRTLKADIYAEHGALEYWLVDPRDESVEMRRLENGKFVRHAFGTGESELVSSLDDALRVVPARLFRKFGSSGARPPKSRRRS